MVVMAVYALIVYLWGLRLPALGRDFALLADPAAHLPALTARLVDWETTLFGGWAPGYHLVNIVLVYLTMVCLFWLVRITVPGPFWMSTLAAVLFMANPATAGGMLHLTAAADLFPCLVVVALTLLYAWDVFVPRLWKRGAYFAIALAAGLLLPQATALFALGLAYEIIVATKERRRTDRLALGAAGFIAVTAYQAPRLLDQGIALGERFVPLYFLTYPIGFLPETAQRIVAMPWLGWLGAAAVIAGVILVGRKVRRRSFWFALAAGVLLRIFGEVRPLDLVHLSDGGHLLSASAFLHLGAAALFTRMMDNPRWRVTVVSGTTILAAVFFGMQIIQQFHWGHAAKLVREFQTKAEVHGDELLGVLPDYQCYKGAPVQLSKSIQFDTPFSTARPHWIILRLHYAKGLEATLEDWGPASSTLILEGAPLKDLDIAPYELVLRGQTELGHVRVTVIEQSENRTALRVQPSEEHFVMPRYILPAKPAEAPSP